MMPLLPGRSIPTPPRRPRSSERLAQQWPQIGVGLGVHLRNSEEVPCVWPDRQSCWTANVSYAERGMHL